MALVSCNCLLPSLDTRKWNEIIKKHMVVGKAEQSILTYVNAQVQGFFADNYTYPVLLKAAGSCSLSHVGFALHAQTIVTGFSCHVFVQTALLNMYGALHCTAEASKLFDKIPVKDMVAWNSMLDAYASNAQMDDALDLFHSMPAKDLATFNIMISGYSSICSSVASARSIFEEIPVKDIVSWNSMLSVYTRAGNMEKAYELFREMPAQNTISWNTMITGCLQSQLYREVLDLFDEMEGTTCKPDHLTVTGALSACSHLGSLEKGAIIHTYAAENGMAASYHVTTALIDMYAKCGSIQHSLQVFYKSPVKDVYCWNAMISALALHGQGYAALKLFNEMRSRRHIIPDDITFIGLLSACSHSGLLQEGRKLFDCMVKDFSISPKLEHYGCMVDLLSRAMRLDDAYRLVESMPFEPGEAILGALLSACVVHQDFDIGERVMKLVCSKASNLTDGEFMMFVNLYSSFSHWQEADRWRGEMNLTGISKTAGYSSIEINGKFHKFLAGETEVIKTDQPVNHL